MQEYSSTNAAAIGEYAGIRCGYLLYWSTRSSACYADLQQGDYLEMLHVDDIKSNDCGVEPYVRFGDRASIVVRPILNSREVFLHPIERFEELSNGTLVRFLRGGKTGAINAVVDIVVRPLIRLLDLLPQDVREEIHALKLLRKEVIKL